MKVASIFAELGLQLTGDSKTNLNEFERQLLSIANAAKEAVAALAVLSKSKIPRGLRTVPAGTPGAAATVVAPAPALVPGTPAAVVPMAQPPLLPTSPAGGKPNLPTSALQGLKALGMIGLKLLGFGTLVLGLKSLISMLGRWVRASMEAAVGTELFSRQTGVSRKTLKEWELATTKAGLAEGEAAGAMKMLAQKRQQILTTGEGATPFLQLGINALGTPEQVMREFQDRTRQMTEAQAVYWGSLIGFSEDFAAFLHSQKGPLRQLGDEVLSDKEQASVTTLNAAWVDLTATMGRLRDKIVADLAPALTGFLNNLSALTGLFAQSKQAREGAGIGLKFASGNYLGAAMGFLGRTQSGGTTTVNNDVSITVPGAGDPRATATAVKAEIEKMNQSAYYQRHQLLGEPLPQ